MAAAADRLYKGIVNQDAPIPGSSGDWAPAGVASTIIQIVGAFFAVGALLTPAALFAHSEINLLSTICLEAVAIGVTAAIAVAMHKYT